MNSSVASTHIPRLSTTEPLRSGWLRTSITSGFVATGAMTASMAMLYGIASALGNAHGNTPQRWLPALTTGEFATGADQRLAIGLALTVITLIPWAIVYAYGFASRLGGQGWKRGAMFALIPWSFSISAFFPLVGLGLFGSSLDAGAAPMLGALFIHIVFGVVLGSTYDLDQGRSRIDDVANANAERSAACGIVLGGLAGYAGGWLIGPSLAGLAGQAMIAFGFGLAGAAVGTMVGSLLGIRVVDERRLNTK